MVGLSPQRTSPFAWISTFGEVANKWDQTIYTSAQAVAAHFMEQTSVLEHRRKQPLTPYNHLEWARFLFEGNLLGKYPKLVHSIQHGFYAGIPTFEQTFTPKNSSSITIHVDEFQ